MMGSVLLQAAVFLAASAIAAPLGRWLRVGSVIGYLAAGVLIGPYGLGFVYTVYQVDSILHIAELGVVLLMFLIGLELRPARLWSMRRAILGAGGVQLAGTTVVLAAIALAMGQGVVAAIVLGWALALSSTAFALQALEERKELNRRHGRLSFSILLFQDIGALPLIAIVPLLGGAAAASAATGGTWLAVAKAVGVVAGVVIAGRWLLGHVYALVARSGVREAMTASALLSVVAIALAMQSVGLSPALGAFTAGVLLAESEYRHQIEADIAPFEGLLLGLFFTAIGMALDMSLLAREPALIATLVAGLLAIKAVVLYGVGRLNGLDHVASRRLALFISQGGEFAFVALTLAVGSEVIGKELEARLAVVVTLSMVATPLLLLLDDLLFGKRPAPEPTYETPPDADRHVIIAGFGRVGQIAARILRAKRIPFTALDINPDQVTLLRGFGAEAYFGNAARLDILEAARTAKASAFVLAIDDVDASVKVAELLRTHFPQVPVYARARNRQHIYRLMDLGVTKLRRETFLSSIELTRDLLAGLGLDKAEIDRTVSAFIEHDRRRLYDDYAFFSDSEKMLTRARDAAAELESILNADEDAEPQRPDDRTVA